MEEIDVIKMVWCPDQDQNVESDGCIFCEFYHGMGTLDFTLKCGFEDNEKNEESNE